MAINSFSLRNDDIFKNATGKSYKFLTESYYSASKTLSLPVLGLSCASCAISVEVLEKELKMALSSVSVVSSNLRLKLSSL